jgi:hypothetical protein
MSLKEDEITAEKKGNFFQIVNTFILTIIGILAIFIFVTVNNIRTDQAKYAIELARIATIQNENVLKISKLESQVNTLMYEYKFNMQIWVDANFKRK